MSSHRFLSLAIGVAALPATAFAQTVVTGERGSAVLEEVVVTAERREASLQEVPVPVTALTAETLQNLQVTESRDLARYTPSLKMFYNITSPTNLSPSMRGALQQDASLVVAESPFGLYVDDVYLARLNGNNVTLADIERVEVLRGPQGTLYGRNTLAGAIKFVSRTPGEDSWLNGSLGGGNFDQYRASFSAGGPLGGNGWAGSISGLINNKDAQFFNRNPSVNDDVGLERNWAARGKLRYNNDALDAIFTVSYADSKNDAAQLVPASTPTRSAMQQFTSDDLVAQWGDNYTLNTPNVPRSPPPLESYPRGETKQTIASLNLTYDFGAASLRSITGYVKTEDFFSTDFSGNGLVNGANKADVDQWSEELQLFGEAFDGRLNYLAGVYLFNEKGDQQFGWASYLPPFFPTAVPTSQSFIEMETQSYSVFAQVDYNFTENLKGTLGLRYTEDDKDFDFRFIGLLPPITPAMGIVDLSNKYTETTPRFGLDYKVNTDAVDSLLLYASAAKGFKSGGYNGIAIFGFNDALTPYFPESNWTYEVGVKTDLLDNRLRINANYYLMQTEDATFNATVTLPNGTTTFPVQNAGEVDAQGLELEVTVVPLDGLNLFLAGAFFVDAEYKSLRPGSAPANAPANFGVTATPAQQPEYSFTIGFDYGIDTGFGRFSFGVDWFETDDYVTAATNDFVVKGYGQGNAFVGLEFGENWGVKAQVKNFTDEDQFTTGSRGFLGGFIPLRPREYLFTVSYDLN
jgi:iron complex outermembrane receptor protein